MINNQKHKIVIKEHFLSDEDCKKLLLFSKNNLDLYENQDREMPSFWAKRILWGFANGIPREIQDLNRQYLKKVENEIQKVSEKSPVYCDTINFVKWWDGYEQLPHADGENPNNEPHPFPWRKFGCVYYLNDDYEGGEIWFPNFGISIKPKPNTMIFFPGDLLHLHGVKNVTKGTRHTIASFWGYDKTRGI